MNNTRTTDTLFASDLLWIRASRAIQKRTQGRRPFTDALERNLERAGAVERSQCAWAAANAVEQDEELRVGCDDVSSFQRQIE